ALLNQGYVFLANSESQEGLLEAAAQINTLTTQAPELGTQTVVTVIGDAAQVQVARSGEPMSLLVSATGASLVDSSDPGHASPVAAADPAALDAALAAAGFAGFGAAAQATLAMPDGQGGAPRPLDQLMATYAQAVVQPFEYPRRDDVPAKIGRASCRER